MESGWKKHPGWTLYSSEDLEKHDPRQGIFQSRELLNPGKIFPQPGRCAEVKHPRRPGRHGKTQNGCRQIRNRSMNATVAEKPVKVSEFVPKNVEQTREWVLERISGNSRSASPETGLRFKESMSGMMKIRDCRSAPVH